ncbi:MAG: type I-E CRISPR-associated protein Cse2/CasB [Candidatus Brocadiaceae bacterium]|nr:type I-E CRISPR-associated protein Cse2/CasB [Candidatus Brocadiaceae bacterium]
MENTEILRKSRENAFVLYVLERMNNDNAFGAALRRADNQATEYQAWEYLSCWCDLEKAWERRSYATIASAIARAKPSTDGTLGIGKAIAACYEDGNKSDSAKIKLRRLLACDSTEEICVILRPLLSLISSRGVHIGYGKLLNELLYFGEKIKVKWAVDFYGRRWKDDSIGV